MAYNVWETCMLVPGFSRGECASWVQAIFSVVAIAASASFVIWQHRLDRRRQTEARRESDLRAIDSLLTLLSRARLELQHALDSFESPDKLREYFDNHYEDASLHLLETALSEIQTPAIGPPHLVLAFMRARESFEKGREHLLRARADVPGSGLGNAAAASGRTFKRHVDRFNSEYEEFEHERKVVEETRERE